MEMSSRSRPCRQRGSPRLLDRPFTKGRPGNEGKFPLYAKCLEIVFLAIIFNLTLLRFPRFYYISMNRNTLLASRHGYFALEVKETMATICGIQNNVLGVGLFKSYFLFAKRPSGHFWSRRSLVAELQACMLLSGGETGAKHWPGCISTWLPCRQQFPGRMA